MKSFQFYEYGGFLDKTGSENDSLVACNFSDAEIKYLRSISESLIPDKRIFDITSTKIKATSMVGVVSFGGVQIEILPKLLRNRKLGESQSANASILQNLMFMLSYTNALEINDTGIGSLAQSNDSFIEAYISIFANRLVRHLIRFGQPKAYVEKSENLNSIKGKISFGKQSTINAFDQSKMFCDYSEFTENNSISRAFKFVSHSLMKLSKNAATISSLNRCVGLLDGVETTYVTAEELARCSLGKRDPNFIALINLTKMFLNKLRPDFSGDRKTKVFALLFDMNELFEEFIFQALKRNESLLGIEVSAQKRKRLVTAERDFLSTGEWVNRSLFDTYTDISVKPKSGPSFIMDTKYKIVHSGKSHYGIGNQDAYQILAYRQIHKDHISEPSVALLYPKSSENLQKEFRVNGSSTTFMAWTIDISVDLKNSMPVLIGNLKELIGRAVAQDRSIVA